MPTSVAQDIDGDTPLHCTAINGQLECARLLLIAGANPAIKNSSYSKTARQMAEQKDHPEDWRLLGRSRDGGPVGESGRLHRAARPLQKS